MRSAVDDGCGRRVTLSPPATMVPVRSLLTTRARRTGMTSTSRAAPSRSTVSSSRSAFGTATRTVAAVVSEAESRTSCSPPPRARRDGETRDAGAPDASPPPARGSRARRSAFSECGPKPMGRARLLRGALARRAAGPRSDRRARVRTLLRCKRWVFWSAPFSIVSYESLTSPDKDLVH